MEHFDSAKYKRQTRLSYAEAHKRVMNIKRFYEHLLFFIMITLLIFLLKDVLLSFLQSQGLNNSDILYWIDINILLTPLWWGLAVFIHAAVVFRWGHRLVAFLKPNAMRKWENDQVDKYLNKE